jgi:uncharacterized protein
MQANIELIGRFTDAFNRGDMDSLAAMLAPDAVWHAGGDNVLSGTYRGRDEVLSFFVQGAAFSTDGITAQPLDALADDRYLTFFVHLQGRRGDRVLDQVHANAWRVDDGVMTEGWFLPADQEEWDRFMAPPS